MWVSQGNHELVYHTISPTEDTRLQMEEAAHRQKEQIRQDRISNMFNTHTQWKK